MTVVFSPFVGKVPADQSEADPIEFVVKDITSLVTDVPVITVVGETVKVGNVPTAVIEFTVVVPPAELTVIVPAGV